MERKALSHSQTTQWRQGAPQSCKATWTNTRVAVEQRRDKTAKVLGMKAAKAAYQTIKALGNIIDYEDTLSIRSRQMHKSIQALVTIDAHMHFSAPRDTPAKNRTSKQLSSVEKAQQDTKETLARTFGLFCAQGGTTRPNKLMAGSQHTRGNGAHTHASRASSPQTLPILGTVPTPRIRNQQTSCISSLQLLPNPSLRPHNAVAPAEGGWAVACFQPRCEFAARLCPAGGDRQLGRARIDAGREPALRAPSRARRSGEVEAW